MQHPHPALLRFVFVIVLTSSFVPLFAAERTDSLPFRFQPGQKAHVAFLGGSITEMDGFRPMVCADLISRFPQTEFTFTAAGISSTCSMTGAARLERDVLSKGPVDLFFVEFAVNDDQDAAHSKERAIRGLEGIIRHIKVVNRNTEIVTVFFANEHLIEEYRQGRTATSIAAHRAVAEHYEIPVVDVAREVQRRIDAGTLTWEQYGGVHPAPFGNRLVADMIKERFSANERVRRSAIETVKPLDPFNYERGRFVSPEGATYSDDWTWGVPEWKSISGSFRAAFSGQKLLCAEKPGAELTLNFDGKAIGAFVLAGPDAGILEYRIDDRPPGKIVLFHSFSSGLHYPRTVMFDDELLDGKHVLRLKLLGETPQGSKGTAARILQFMAN